MKYLAAIPLFLLAIGAASGESQSYPLPDAIYSLRVLPATRVGADYQTYELDQHRYYKRTQTLSAFGEYAINEFFSVSMFLPWTRRTETKFDTTTRFDNMGLGLHFANVGSFLVPVGGINLTLPTGREQDGIGSKRIFNVEPYAGLGGYSDWFSILGVVRYNTETNRQFREDVIKKDNFARAWICNVTMGATFQYVDALLEYQYKYVYDPDPKKLSQHSIAPGVNLKLGNLILGISVPYTLSKDREAGVGVIARAYGRF